MIFIDDLILSPIKGLIAIAKKIREMAEAEMNDEGKLKERLLKIQTMYEFGQIDKKDYKRQEKEIIERLNQIRKNKYG